MPPYSGRDARADAADALANLKAPELAVRWRCSLRTIRERTTRNEIPHFRVGDLVLYPVPAIEEYERTVAMANLRPAEPAKSPDRVKRVRPRRIVQSVSAASSPTSARRPVRPDEDGAA